MSRHSARLIQNFLTNTLARTTQEDSASDKDDASDVEDEIPRLQLSRDDVRSIMFSKFQGEVVDGNDEVNIPGNEGPARKKAKFNKLHGFPTRHSQRCYCLEYSGCTECSRLPRRRWAYVH